MSVHPRPLSVAQSAKSRRWPCNGLCCFSVGHRMNLTYDEAYTAILQSTQCSVDEATKKITFSPEGYRRITILNGLYYPRAKAFIYAHYLNLHKQRQEAEAKKRAEQNPTPTP